MCAVMSVPIDSTRRSCPSTRIAASRVMYQRENYTDLLWMAEGGTSRITSYNVCYTKLLRPEELRMLAGTLKAAGIRAKDVDVLDAILDALERRLKDPGNEQNFLEALELLRTRSATLGRSVTVRNNFV